MKTALFLKPSRLKQRWSPLELIHISKGAKGIETAKDLLDQDTLTRYFPGWTSTFRETVLSLGDEALTAKVAELTRTHAKQKAGTSLTQYVNRSFMRHTHQVLEQLWMTLCTEKIYHQVVNPATGNHLTTTCQLFPGQPVLNFLVHRDNTTGLSLEARLLLNDQQYTLTEFEQQLFFLQRDGTFYLLRFADYQTLQWLAANDPAVYAMDPVGFSEQVLARLTSDGYAIETSAMDDIETISVEPVHAIYLSEISNAFLLLTPRWNYDGFWVEGPWVHSERVNRNGKLYDIQRSREKETGFVDRLQALHPLFAKQLNGVFHLNFAEAKKKHWFLKVYHQLLTDNVELLGMAFLRHFRYAPYPVETAVNVLEKNDAAIILEMKVTCGAEEIRLLELQKLLLAGQKSLLLKDHSIVVLTEEWLHAYSTLVKHGRVAERKLTVPPWIFLAAEDRLNTAVRPLPQIWLEKWQRWQSTEEKLYSLPETVQAQLRPYQQKGFEWLCLLHEIGAGGCLADDMGLGKTLQTISFLARLKQNAPDRPAMIVCPASLVHNWRIEMEKFAPSLRPFVYHESTRSLEDYWAPGKQPGVLITSYGTLRADDAKLQAIEWEAVVLDESHSIKNPAAQITRAVYQLRAKAKVALSGTPVMNNSIDLFAQLQFLLPGMMGTLEFFRKEYAVPIDRDQDEEKISALQKLTAPFLLRRTKQQVASDLPPKTEMLRWCEMGTEQKAFYDETLSQVRDSIFLNIKNEGLGKSKLSILQGMQRLRQICAAPQLLPEASGIPSVKISALMEELREPLRQKKVLVFSQFKGVLHQLAHQCKQQGIAYYHFDGETPAAKRMEMVEAFQATDNQVNVFLISLKAGNTGLTLTAAEYVFLVDPWWNTAVQQQAVDRAYRIGQTKNVFAYQMICKDSIEEKIVELQQRKRSLSDALVGDDDGLMRALTEEDLRYLFS
ncbi:DEAD/DEAH box helicase [Flavihumibacter petaseus]|nr:DEAD/DEAH box helicase [Flavihumibacter petaseus]